VAVISASISAGSFSFELTTVPPLPLLELDGLCAKLDRHEDLTGGIGLPPWSDGLLLGDGLPFAVDLVHRWMVRTWVWVFEKQLLLLLPRARVAKQEAIMRMPSY
jgi:hypothetical protein